MWSTNMNLRTMENDLEPAVPLGVAGDVEEAKGVPERGQSLSG